MTGLACNICHRPVMGAGAALDLHQEAAVLAIHLVDKHWPLVQKIHATTGNGPARTALVDQLEMEMRE